MDFKILQNIVLAAPSRKMFFPMIQTQLRPMPRKANQRNLWEKRRAAGKIIR